MYDCSVTPARCPLGADRNILTQRHRCRSSNQPSYSSGQYRPAFHRRCGNTNNYSGSGYDSHLWPPTRQRVANSTSKTPNPHGVQQDEMELGTSVTVDAKTAGHQEI